MNNDKSFSISNSRESYIQLGPAFQDRIQVRHQSEETVSQILPLLHEVLLLLPVLRLCVRHRPTPSHKENLTYLMFYVNFYQKPHTSGRISSSS